VVSNGHLSGMKNVQRKRANFTTPCQTKSSWSVYAATRVCQPLPGTGGSGWTGSGGERSVSQLEDTGDAKLAKGLRVPCEHTIPELSRFLVCHLGQKLLGRRERKSRSASVL
jgi:hypothetical protein